MRLGKLQYTILQTLYTQGPLTARALTEALAPSGAVAHSTIQTLLRQLETKGLVAHEVEDRTFVFRALRAPDEVAQTPLRELLARVYEGSVYGMMAHLLQQEKLSEAEKQQLRELLDSETSQKEDAR
ncbi:BlaI/MecI/CopY family transcriptional regulator [Armatimonas sp.]|uniref:BlaI/MecI/CopY family transcriptional regulator n=1 Tax=Armatimonas sp. TaxID=1872638 RepID=UPI00286C5BB1|nr:BlaI/MecI/CopY family transcriptional regulator [Armatimonas sp.]